MKLNFSKYKNIINVLLPLIITVGTFYSGNIDQKISQIYSDYIIDTNTLNNSFITLNIKAAINDDDGFQKIKNDIGEYLEKFNKKFEPREKEKKVLEHKKKWADRSIYILSFLLFIINVVNIKTKQTVVAKNE